MSFDKVWEQVKQFFKPADNEPHEIIVPKAVLVPVRARRIATQRNIRPRPYL